MAHLRTEPPTVSTTPTDDDEDIAERLMDLLDEVDSPHAAADVLAVALGQLLQQEGLDLDQHVQTVRGSFHMSARAEARAALYVQRIKGTPWVN